MPNAPVPYAKMHYLSAMHGLQMIPMEPTQLQFMQARSISLKSNQPCNKKQHILS